MLKIVAFYSDKNEKTRHSSVTGNSVVEYIYDVLIKQGLKCEIISPSWYKYKHKFTRKIEKYDDCNRRVIYSPSIKKNENNRYILQSLLSWCWLILFLLKNSRKGELILTYHVTNLMIPLLIAKKIKKLKFITYFGELYQDVYEMPKIEKKLEIKFMNSCDGFILANKNLINRLDFPSKKMNKFVVLLGPYNSIKKHKIEKSREKTRIVYAGKINYDKGVSNIIKVAKYLNKNYEIFVLGYGCEHDINLLNKQIKTLGNSECSVKYLGLLVGEEYNYFLQSCHIGICLQNTDAAFNQFSFPSKILSYLGNGLKVLCVDMESVKNTILADTIAFCPTVKPDEVAKAILNIDLFGNLSDSSEVIAKLDNDFSEDIINLLRICKDA